MLFLAFSGPELTEGPVGKMAGQPGQPGQGLRGGSHHGHHQPHQGGRERDWEAANSTRDPADPAPFLPTPMRVSLGRREDINPYATFRLPGAGAGGPAGPPGPPQGLSPVHRHPLQSPQHTVCMVRQAYIPC